MLYLLKHLNLLSVGSLKTEQKAIIQQFYVFIVAYTTRAIFKFSVNNLENTGNFFHILHILEACLVLLWYPIPVSYVLLCVHYRSFSNSLKMRESYTPSDLTAKEPLKSNKETNNTDEIEIEMVDFDLESCMHMRSTDTDASKYSNRVEVSRNRGT